MRMYRLVVAGAVLALALGTSSVAFGYWGGHGGNGFGGSGRDHHHGPAPEEEVKPPGVTGSWADLVSFTGLTVTQLGIVNGFKETRIETSTPSLSSLARFPGVDSLEGRQPITINEACVPAGSACNKESPGTTESVGLDGCEECTLYGPSGEVLGTGSIDMPWWEASGQAVLPQHVVLLEHGTGGLADVHGVLTHPGVNDPRCADGLGKPGNVGCDTGTVHEEKCISGGHGALFVAPGESVCLSPGARIFGPTNIGKDGELFAEGATFYGPVRSDQAYAFSLCASAVLGSVSVSGTTGPVEIGEPATGVCGGNFIQGALDVEHNGCATCDADGGDTGAVDISGDTVLGPLRSTENVGAYVLGYLVSNTVYGRITNVGNS
jgi:hypothetical protein